MRLEPLKEDFANSLLWMRVGGDRVVSLASPAATAI
jgi:hypothetical protein